MGIISHFNEIFTKSGQKRIKAGKVSKEQVKCCQKVTSCSKAPGLVKMTFSLPEAKFKHFMRNCA